MIVPMNPNDLFYDDRKEPGMVSKQIGWQEKRGKVIIAFDKPCIYAHEKPKPSLGFFYDTLNRLVTHRFKIIDIVNDEQACNYLNLKQQSDDWKREYLPPWREKLFEKSCELPGKKQTWMLITDICELKDKKKLAYFGKKICRSFVYSPKGSELTT